MTLSESSPFAQSGESNADDLNCSILSYSRAVATAICRLFTFALTAKENMLATATNPHAAINDVINTSIRVKPELRVTILMRIPTKGRAQSGYNGDRPRSTLRKSYRKTRAASRNV